VIQERRARDKQAENGKSENRGKKKKEQTGLGLFESLVDAFLLHGLMSTREVDAEAKGERELGKRKEREKERGNREKEGQID
jgi:hypothetical protein